MQAVPAKHIITATANELAAHAPFDAMARADLEWMVERMTLAYCPDGAEVLPAGAVVTHLLIIQRGEVRAFAPTGEAALTLTVGEVFPIGALIAGRPTVLRFVAHGDAFLYKLPLADAQTLLARSRPLLAFCTQRLANLLDESRRSTVQEFVTRAQNELSMGSSLADALRRAPITVGAATTIREALTTMQTKRIGSVVIVDDASQPLGIFTQTDVIGRIVLPQVPLDQPIASVMSKPAATLELTSTLADAAEVMARRGFRHVVVTDRGKVAGVISERDLFSLQRLSLKSLAREIKSAPDVDALALSSSRIQQLAATLIAQGVGSEQLTQFVTALNDLLVERVIALRMQGDGVAEGGWCWMALGSEGRREQTLATDQDNAIIFTASEGERESVRRTLLTFADRVNHDLARVGFPLCEGGIMAGNPKWCLTLDEWKAQFSDWVANTDPQAVLDATIFFDFRALTGDANLVDALAAHLQGIVKARPVFLRVLTENALKSRPPLGLFGDVQGDASGEIDLKKQVARVFVDAARILALATGSTTTNTGARLRSVASALRIPNDEVADFVESFHFIQLLRLKRQHALRRETVVPPGRNTHNRIDPATLSPLDQRILKEALRQARKLQQRVQMDYLHG